ncbi:MAG TPA: hypothetical protein VFW63_02985 [Acidimicrobiales bacterium]|nr:hypothetical protein [Acidimicrobiales bacterium]
MVSVSPETWDLLDALYAGGGFPREFEGAWMNGVALLEAVDGLRGRRPVLVEWRGNQKQPGDEPVPADLRIDHVYLVSCKYLSKIVTNTSPAGIFDRLLAGGHGGRSPNWYAEVAPAAYEALYRAVRDHLGGRLPGREADLSAGQRAAVARELRGRWPVELREVASTFSAVVAEASAARWRSAIASADRERVLWRLLRIGGAPYFVLGSSPAGALRLRVGTVWDWRQRFRVTSFDVQPCVRGQPEVRWEVAVQDRRTRATSAVAGHVEIRWSHGKFAQPPEAKVYLDTPHQLVPGYWPLV